LTRKSMVNHFWSYEDCRDGALEIRPGKFMLRHDRMFVAPNFADHPPR